MDDPHQEQRREAVSAATAIVMTDLLSKLRTKAICYVVIDQDGALSGGSVVNQDIINASGESLDGWIELVSSVSGMIVRQLQEAQELMEQVHRPNID